MDDEVQAEGTPKISGVPLEKLTATYIKIRDAPSDLKRNYERADEELADQLFTIEQEMLIGACQANGGVAGIVQSVEDALALLGEP